MLLIVQQKKTDPLDSIRSFVVPDILINWFRKHLQLSPIGLCPTFNRPLGSHVSSNIISFRFTSSDHRECQTPSAYLVMFKAEFLSLSLFDFGSWSWEKIWKKTPWKSLSAACRMLKKASSLAVTSACDAFCCSASLNLETGDRSNRPSIQGCLLPAFWVVNLKNRINIDQPLRTLQ